MKKIIFLALAIFCALQVSAQNPELVKQVSVNGVAEMEITPDIIYVNITLKEYFRDVANRRKVEIDVLEKELQTAVLAAGIPSENFTVDNIYGYNYDWNKKKGEEFLGRKRYRIKVSDLKKINEIISNVDGKGIESVNIGEFSHTKIEQYKSELMIKAVQNAKFKAETLLGSIGEKLDGLIQLSANSGYFAPPMIRSNEMYSTKMATDEFMPEIEVRTIKLREEVQATFKIK